MSFQAIHQDKAAVWREALLLPSETDLVESGLRELAEYFDISREAARQQCMDALAESKREWEAEPRRTLEQIKDFYRWTRSYIFEHVWWHATDIETNSANVEILRCAISRSAHVYLDFGSGVGANAILFARHGFQVTLADISSPMLEFARWRLQRRGIAVTLINLNHQALPSGQFDFVTAVDVLEHLPRPKDELKQISLAMKEGGALAFNCRAGEDDERPMHVLKTANPVRQVLRACGFRQLEEERLRQLDLFIVERITQTGWESWRNSIYDGILYSRLFTPNELNGNGKPVRHPQRVYFERIESVLQSEPNEPQTHWPWSYWLDVGCGRHLIPQWMGGHVEWEAKLVARVGLLAGIDPDLAALRDNDSCPLKSKADATALPFADGSFDLVTSNMVFEHVEKPLASLNEIRRVLRPGGRLLVLTPNWLDIVTIAARMVPNRFHPAIISRIETRGAADVYPTYFRFNRPRTVEACLREAGFKQWRIEQIEHPDAYSHVPVAAHVESAWHRAAHRWPALRGVLLIEAEAGE
ncbi:MAG: methyltransferase domain-containing protein [Acidobacteriota bacterium]|nr:methyltransferase domain-containing protein [Acidobacteriota bacterium]